MPIKNERKKNQLLMNILKIVFFFLLFASKCFNFAWLITYCSYGSNCRKTTICLLIGTGKKIKRKKLSGLFIYSNRIAFYIVRYIVLMAYIACANGQFMCMYMKERMCSIVRKRQNKEEVKKKNRWWFVHIKPHAVKMFVIVNDVQLLCVYFAFFVCFHFVWFSINFHREINNVVCVIVAFFFSIIHKCFHFVCTVCVFSFHFIAFTLDLLIDTIISKWLEMCTTVDLLIVLISSEKWIDLQLKLLFPSQTDFNLVCHCQNRFALVLFPIFSRRFLTFKPYKSWKRWALISFGVLPFYTVNR